MHIKKSKMHINSKYVHKTGMRSIYKLQMLSIPKAFVDSLINNNLFDVYQKSLDDKMLVR